MNQFTRLWRCQSGIVVMILVGFLLGCEPSSDTMAKSESPKKIEAIDVVMVEKPMPASTFEVNAENPIMKQTGYTVTVEPTLARREAEAALLPSLAVARQEVLGSAIGELDVKDGHARLALSQQLSESHAYRQHILTLAKQPVQKATE